MISLYAMADLLMTLVAVLTSPKNHIFQIFLPIVFFILHISYGIGTLVGIIEMPFFKLKIISKRRASNGTADNDNR